MTALTLTIGASGPCGVPTLPFKLKTVPGGGQNRGCCCRAPSGWAHLLGHEIARS